MPPPRIYITDGELAQAREHGNEVNDECHKNNRKSAAHQTDSYTYEDHYVGGCAKIAVAKYFGLKEVYLRFMQMRHADFRADVHVRGSYGSKKLILRPGDPWNWIYMCASIDPFDYHYVDLLGYIKGSAGKKKQWFHSYNGRPLAYFVPAKELKPIEKWKLSMRQFDIGEKCRKIVLEYPTNETDSN